MKTTRWALCLIFFGTLANGADVYRSTDANGVPKYSDRPEQNSERVYVATSRPGRPGNTVAPRAAGAPADANAARPDAQSATAPGQNGEPPEAAAASAETRTKNCTIARERQKKYSESHRLYRDLGNGEREYLTDAQTDEAKARAATDVSTWCG